MDRSIPMFRLENRGGNGLCCDERGVALGPVALVESADANRNRVYHVRPAEEIAHALALAYAPFTADDLARRLSGLDVAARALEAGDVAKAMIATVLLKRPPLSADAMAKLVRDPAFKKYNPYHKPGHVPGAGQFTDADGASGGGINPVTVADRRSDANPNSQRLSPAAIAAGIEAMQPVYKQDLVKQPEWTSFNNAVAAIPGIMPTEQFVFAENFAAEGGISPDRSVVPATVSGITNKTLQAAKKAGVPGLEGVSKPEDLDDTQRAAVYRYSYNHALGRIGGSAALDTIGDRYTAAAVGDTLFRDGEVGGADLVRDTLKDIYNSIPRSKRRALGLDAGFTKETERLGPRSLDTLQRLVKGGYAQKFRDALADRRQKKRTRETERNDNFRFKGK